MSRQMQLVKNQLVYGMGVSSVNRFGHGSMHAKQLAQGTYEAV